MNIAAAFPVSDASGVSEPRRTAVWLAEQLGFPTERAGRVALVVSELATNLAKHARAGELLLRALPAPDGTGQDGIEMLAIDRGPGIPDEAMSRRDGYSTSGTLGHGLGAIQRQSDFFELHSLPSGTAALARIWRERPPAAAAGPRHVIGAVQVSKPGEDVCGDACGWRLRDDRLAIVLADGLGHGLLAHEAAICAVQTFARVHDSPPSRIIDDVHAALRGTRGAAVATLIVDLSRGTASYCGLGNVTTAILLPSGGRTNAVSQNGTAGHSAGRLQEFHYAVPPGAIVVMYSDGLGSHWDLSAYPGLAVRDPSLIAAVLYRDFSRRRDDVTVVVAAERQAKHFFAQKL